MWCLFAENYIFICPLRAQCSDGIYGCDNKAYVGPLLTAINRLLFLLTSRLASNHERSLVQPLASFNFPFSLTVEIKQSEFIGRNQFPNKN